MKNQAEEGTYMTGETDRPCRPAEGQCAMEDGHIEQEHQSL